MKVNTFKILKRDLFVGLSLLLFGLLIIFGFIYGIITNQLKLIHFIISPFALLFTIPGCYIFFVGTLRNFIQVLIIDKEGIRVRNIFSTIYKCNWDNILNIIIVNFNDNKTYVKQNTSSHFDKITRVIVPKKIKVTKYIVFDDGREDEFHNKILSYYIPFSNKQPIKITYSNKVIKICEYYNKNIITEVIKGGQI